MGKSSGKRDRGSATRNRRQAHPASRLPIIYEDDALIAVNKPAGLTAVPVKGLEMPSALSLLTADLKARRQRVFVVHRIDRFTSGILLFARTQADRDILVRQFLQHTPLRQYLAVIRGHMAMPEGTLVHYFRRQGMFQKLSSPRHPRSARAELHYSLERRLRDASLVRVTLVTGLQNQIRVQFSVLGHPVIGDRKYHPPEAEERRISRVALHAAHLEFLHPRSQARVSLDCPLPADFQSLVASLSPARRP